MKSIIRIGLLLLFVLYPSASWSRILFEDNFDSQPDWSPTQLSSMSISYTSTSEFDMPVGYTNWRVGRSENLESPGNNTLNINSAQPRGGAGKSFLFWSEMTKDWGADGLLGITFPDEPEIYIRWYFKAQPDWRWRDTSYNQTAMKFLHASHFDIADPGSEYDYFSDTQNKPRVLYTFNKYNGSQSNIAVSWLLSWYDYGTSRREITYYPGSLYSGEGTDWWSNAADYEAELIADGIYADYLPHDQGMMGDGEWHCWEWHLKMNTADGVADGVYEAWLDGIPMGSFTDIMWANTESATRHWNRVWLGGNNINTYDDGGGADPWDRLNEQWYAIDDFVVSTEYIGPDYVIGPGSSISLSITTTSQTVPNATTDITIEGTTSTTGDPVTSVTCVPVTANTGTLSNFEFIVTGLEEGQNVITVTADDGTDTTSSSITVTRLADEPPVPQGLLEIRGVQFFGMSIGIALSIYIIWGLLTFSPRRETYDV
jgi:hypothetical protein